MSKKPTPKQMMFVAEYLKDSNGSRAAIAAGYSKKNARHQAHELLHKNELVMAAVDQERKRLSEAAKYNYETAMAEINDAIRFAREKENSSAEAKLIELKLRLNGMYVEKHDVRQAGRFQLQFINLGLGEENES